MAETKPTATTSVKATSVQAKKSSNAISWLAPLLCLVAGYVIWRFLMGDQSAFVEKDGGFWPKYKTLKDPNDAFHRIYTGGIIVFVLIGMLLMVITFSIERFLTIRKA